MPAVYLELGDVAGGGGAVLSGGDFLRGIISMTTK